MLQRSAIECCGDSAGSGKHVLHSARVHDRDSVATQTLPTMSDVDEIEELEWRRNRAMDPQVQGSGDGAGEGTGSSRVLGLPPCSFAI